jgi:hypothetical protein
LYIALVEVIEVDVRTFSLLTTTTQNLFDLKESSLRVARKYAGGRFLRKVDGYIATEER